MRKDELTIHMILNIYFSI